MTWQEFLSSVDDSNPMTTAREHIADLCRIVEGRVWQIVELGSHAGISAAAMALAAPQSEVVSVDLCDTVPQDSRVAYWLGLGIQNITPVESDAASFLLKRRQVDFIFHDAAHGDAVADEYVMGAMAVRQAMAIHDWDQLSPHAQVRVTDIFMGGASSTADSRGRRLFVGWK